MLRAWRLRGAAGLALVCAVPSAAQPPADASVEVTAAVERIVESTATDGGVRFELEPVAAVAALDRLVYTVRFTNTSNRQLDNVRVTGAIPAFVSYVEDSASGPGVNVLFSVDGGRTFGAAAELLVPDGEATVRRAEAADYTHVRWLLETPLDAGATAFARFRAAAR